LTAPAAANSQVSLPGNFFCILRNVPARRGSKNGGRMEVNGMLAMVDWLRVPVETFVRDS